MQTRICKLNRNKEFVREIELHVAGILGYLAYHDEIEMVQLIKRIKRQDLNIAEIAKIIADSPLKYYEFYGAKGDKWNAFSSIDGNFYDFESKHDNIYPIISKDKVVTISDGLKGRCEMWCREVLFFDVKRVNYA
jgi:hypothetical protein